MLSDLRQRNLFSLLKQGFPRNIFTIACKSFESVFLSDFLQKKTKKDKKKGPKQKFRSFSDPYGFRTRVTSVKGWSPRPLDERVRGWAVQDLNLRPMD